MSLDISVNTILSIDMEIDELKKLIRRYSKRNNYKFLKQCLLSITNYNFNYLHHSSSLDYFEKKVEIKLEQEPSFDLIQDKMKHVHQYFLELVDELYEEVREF